MKPYPHEHKSVKGETTLEPAKGKRCHKGCYGCDCQLYYLPISDDYTWITCDNWKATQYYRTKLGLVKNK